ncbi:MAG: M36 family metallopeptidase [Phycisphaerales bacterium]
MGQASSLSRWRSRVFAAWLRGLSLMVAPLAGQAALAQSEPVPPDSWARRQEIAQLGEITPNVAADFDPVLGTPTFIRSTTAFLTRRSGRTAAQIVADFVNDNPATFGVSLSGGNIAGAEQFTPATYRTIRDFETPTLGPTGVRHLTYQQTHNGQDIYGSLLTANVTGDGMLVNIGSRFVAEPAGPITPPACDEANRTVRDIVAAACDEVSDSRIADIVNLISPEAVCAFDWKAGHAFQGVGDTALWVRSVLCPIAEGGVVQAWHVRLPSNPEAEGAAWECVIGHSDLSLLTIGDMTLRCQPEPVEFIVHRDTSPVPGIPGFDTYPLSATTDTECEKRAELDTISDCPNVLNDSRESLGVTAGDMLPWSPNGWLNEPSPGYAHCESAEPSITCGNNVRVSVTEASPPIAGPSRVFGAGVDHRSAESAAVLAFVVTNEWHDLMMRLGFDEPAGNYQAVNGGSAGIAGDALWVFVNPGNMQNYASNTYPIGVEDGQRTNINFNAYTTVLDGLRFVAHDRTALYHELTHAISVRLHVGTPFMATGSLGDFGQTLGLWEGWCDAMAILLATSPEDDPDINYPVFTWPGRYRSGGDVLQHYYFGGNLYYPYTQNKEPFDAGGSRKAISPLTFGHIDPGPTGGVPPKALPTYGGAPFNKIRDIPAQANPASTRVPVPDRRDKYFVASAWATAIVDARARLAEEVGMGEANDVLLQLAVDSMKLDPGTPNFIQSRDSLLQADLLRSGGAHRGPLMRGFARRGLGESARCQGSAVRDVEEAFDEPPEGVAVFFPDGIPYTIDTCEGTSIEVLAVGTRSAITGLRGMAAPNPQAIGLSGQDARHGVRPGQWFVDLTPAPCRQDWSLWVEAATVDTPQYEQCGASTVVFAGVEALVLFDDMEDTTTAWTTAMAAPYVPGYPDEGRWDRVDPMVAFATPGQDSTPGTGRLCWVTDNRGSHSIPTIYADVDSEGDGVELTSPELAVWPNTTVLVELSLWYVSHGGEPGDEECVVEWVTPGQQAVPLIGPLMPAHSARVWRRLRAVVDTGSLSGGLPKVRIRFTDPPADSLVEGGVDDVRVSMIHFCRDCCDGDMNRDDNVDQDDVAYLVGVVGGGENPTGTDPDFNHDGNVDQDDVAALINYVAGAGCP